MDKGMKISETTRLKYEVKFYRELLEQISKDPRKTIARRLAESGLLFWDQVSSRGDGVQTKVSKCNLGPFASRE